MNALKPEQKIKPTKLSAKAMVSSLLTFTLCSVLIVITIFNRISVEKFKMEQLIIEKSSKATQVISRLLYKTQTLSAFVIQGQGEIRDFEMIASTIVDDPVILNILIAPGGKVSNVYPLKGNEAVIGLDFFAEGAGNREAMMAVESGSLVFGGPFDLIQGGQALVGRLPVYLNNSNGESSLWGLVSVTLKYPQVLDTVGLGELQLQGFAYEIWRTSPDTGEKQIITGSGYKYNKTTRYIEKQIPILNADWYFRILPVRTWYEYPETWMMVFASIFISLLIAYVMQSNNELILLKSKFESLAQTDSLTGILNRRHFMELAELQFERSCRLGSPCFIVIFDVDNFKRINDEYGHPMGDFVLEEFVQRVKNTVRPYDLFARYGGEEFILLFTDLGKADVQNLVERIRISICEPRFEIGASSATVTASFGIAPVNSSINLEASINQADKALYKAKEEGKNRAVFYAT